ncbi:hypothetical protein RUM43_012761 [Polyplax serrata]|uniref:Uncharacterized protein n=1 Tax=Polyplax serrata TaxID=468196 RepID=A0AAN8PJJ1_POLSC
MDDGGQESSRQGTLLDKSDETGVGFLRRSPGRDRGDTLTLLQTSFSRIRAVFTELTESEISS